MNARELSRQPLSDGRTIITVALGATRQGVLIVPSDMVDQPGYQDMLNAYAAKHAALVGLVEDGTPL